MTTFRIKSFLEFLKLAAETLWVILCLFPILLEAVLRLIFPPKPKDVNGQVALITGAAQGLGRSMAHELSQRGCRVICVDVNAEANEKTAKELVKLGRKAESYTCDISNRDSVAELAKKVGPVDILINNAGIIVFDALLDTSPALIQKVMDVNVSSHFWMIHAFLPGMLERNKGHIVATASCAGLCGLANATVYSASKFAVVGLMTTLEEELRLRSKNNIKITCVCPFFVRTITEVDTRIRSRLPKLETEEAAQQIIQGVLREESLITIPYDMQGRINLLRLLPKKTQNMFRDVFFAYAVARSGAELKGCELKAQKND